MEVQNEKLLTMYRAMYDLFIRDCGRVHNHIIESFKGSSDIKSYTKLLEACIDIKRSCPVANHGQLGLENSFVEGLIKKQNEDSSFS